MDHAQDIIADLLNAVVTPLRPAFHLAKLEGDAAFMYSPIESVDGSVLLDLVESCYFNFRRRLLTIGQASICQCNACMRLGDLDLKLVIHHGEAIRHEVLGSQELVGPDVIITHRLLKNHVVDHHDVGPYALLTDACMDSTALNPAALGMMRHEEEYDGVGPIGGWIHDLGRAWALEHERRRVYVGPDDAMYSSEGFISGMTPAALWEWISVPARKIMWETGFDDITESPPEGGRRSVGGGIHCMHGEDVINMQVLDWRPPRYITSTGSFPNGAPFVVTDEVVEHDDGVIVRKNMRAPTPEARDDLATVLEMFVPILDAWIPTLVELAEQERSKADDVAEPALPAVDESARLSTAVGAPD
ncbi:MAG: DUF2652 domain-containing protein [Nitriliruptoraceae bacterium]